MSEAPENEIFEPDESRTGEEIHAPEHESNGQSPAIMPSQSSTAWPIETQPNAIPEMENVPDTAPTGNESLLFQSWSRPEFRPQPRTPHFGHVAILSLLVCVALLISSLVTRWALSHHLFGVTDIKQATVNIHYTLGSMAMLYLFTLLGCVVVFPLFWHRSFFHGVQWRGTLALQLRHRLLAAAFLCFLLALLNGWLMPGPPDTPIDKLFRTQVAAWMMFGFGVTFAPFFEEVAFRGFLLPSVCTALDWIGEKNHHEPAPPLDINGHPQWSILSMLAGSLLVSVPFALMHAEQTGYSLGPFLLLICVSLVLCWVRLSTRSLAASVIVHACYNFLLFSLMMLGTSGFRHLDKM